MGNGSGDSSEPLTKWNRNSFTTPSFSVHSRLSLKWLVVTHHRSLFQPSYGTAARWADPERAGCSPTSVLFSSSGWHPAGKAAETAACEPCPGTTTCSCPPLTHTHKTHTHKKDTWTVAHMLTWFYTQKKRINTHKRHQCIVKIMQNNKILNKNLSEL